MTRFAIYSTASTVHFMSGRLTMHLMDQFDWFAFIAACTLILMGVLFGAMALWVVTPFRGSKEGRS